MSNVMRSILWLLAYAVYIAVTYVVGLFLGKNLGASFAEFM